MRNGWNATAGENCIQLPVIDLLSKDETVPAVTARLSVRFVFSSRSSRSLSRAPGSLLSTRTPSPTLIPLASNCAISEKNVRWSGSMLRPPQSHSDPSHWRRKRQTNCNRCERRSKGFSSQTRPVKLVLVGIRWSASSASHSEIGKLRSRLHPATTGNRVHPSRWDDSQQLYRECNPRITVI